MSELQGPSSDVIFRLKTGYRPFWSKLAQFTLSVGLITFGSAIFTYLLSKYGILSHDLLTIEGGSFYIGAALIGGIILGIFGALTYSAGYLGLLQSAPTAWSAQQWRIIKQLREDLDEASARIQSNLQATEASKVEEIANSFFQHKTQNYIDEKFQAGISEVLDSKLLHDHIASRNNKENLAEVDAFSRRILNGMHSQINKQQRNANFNVFWGVTFSTFGLAAMGSFVFIFYQAENEAIDITKFMIHFIPKLTFVLIFESIAFFFFRAYREDRSMVRYLRNEATNVEAKVLGSMLSLRHGEKHDVSASVLALMQTERNFILKKGERAIVTSLDGRNKFLIEEVFDKSVPTFISRLTKNQKERET